jgi:hypothetical protein
MYTPTKLGAAISPQKLDVVIGKKEDKKKNSKCPSFSCSTHLLKGLPHEIKIS